MMNLIQSVCYWPLYLGVRFLVWLYSSVSGLGKSNKASAES